MIFSNFADSIAVTDPVEVRAPDVGVGDREGPTAGSSFPNKGMVVRFGGAATTGGAEDWLQTSTFKGEVKFYSQRVGWIDCGE